MNTFFKKNLKVFILLTYFLNFAFAQKSTLINNSRKFNVDSITMLPPIGYISTKVQGAIVPHDSLTIAFEKLLKEALMSNRLIKVGFPIDRDSVNTEDYKYIVKTIEKFNDLHSSKFSKIPIGEKFEKVVEKYDGRYFGVIFYNGYNEADMATEVSKSVALGVTTAILSGGLFVAYTVPYKSYFNILYLLIDKKEKCFVIFKRRFQENNIYNIKSLKKFSNSLVNEFDEWE